MSDFAIYDVFTDQAFGGNPLAVVFDGSAYDDAQMQRIASEFNLSETTFVCPANNPAHAARLRIFTPQRELPFAGHPTVGTAIALAERRIDKAMPDNGIDLVEVLEETVGPVRCAVRLTNNKPGFAEFDLPRLSKRFTYDVNANDMAAALGVDAHEIGFENHAVSIWSAGVPFVMVPVHDLSIAAKLRLDPGKWNELAPKIDGIPADCFAYCREGVNHEASFHARMFAPSMGITEDPATGAAVAALSGAIHHFDELLDGHHSLLIEQGVEMGRPSHISLHLECADGTIAKGRIGGQAVRVAEGRLTF